MKARRDFCDHNAEKLAAIRSGAPEDYPGQRELLSLFERDAIERNSRIARARASVENLRDLDERAVSVAWWLRSVRGRQRDGERWVEVVVHVLRWLFEGPT